MKELKKVCGISLLMFCSIKCGEMKRRLSSDTFSYSTFIYWPFSNRQNTIDCCAKTVRKFIPWYRRQ